MTGPIRAVIFDFGGVVCSFDYGIFCRRLAARTGVSPERIEACAFHCDLQTQLESGQVSGPEYHRRLMAQLGVDVPYHEFCPMYGDIFTELPETIALVRALRTRYPLLLLSDTNEIHFDYVRRRIEALALFDHLVLSYEIGTMKPARRIFDEAARRAAVPACSCLFIDDRAINIEGARRAGMAAIQFHAVDQCATELRRLGVAV